MLKVYFYIFISKIQKLTNDKLLFVNWYNSIIFVVEYIDGRVA